MKHKGLAEYTRTTSAKDVKYITEFRMWILGHLDMPHSLDSLSAQAGFSISKMQRLFHRVFGTSIMAFIRHEKLVRAKSQIEVTSTNIKTIAWQAGYRSLPAFTAAFAEAFDITPAQLRRSTIK
jgi:AraC-like DNA-binding protein